jgi:hypothetical protein
MDTDKNGCWSSIIQSRGQLSEKPMFTGAQWISRAISRSISWISLDFHTRFSIAMNKNARIYRQNRVYQCAATMHTGTCYLAMALVHVANFIGIWSCTAVSSFRHTLRASRISRNHEALDIALESRIPRYVRKCKWANVGRTDLSYLHRRLRFSSADISRDLQIETHPRSCISEEKNAEDKRNIRAPFRNR